MQKHKILRLNIEQPYNTLNRSEVYSIPSQGDRNFDRGNYEVITNLQTSFKLPIKVNLLFCDFSPGCNNKLFVFVSLAKDIL